MAKNDAKKTGLKEKTYLSLAKESSPQKTGRILREYGKPKTLILVSSQNSRVEISDNE